MKLPFVALSLLRNRRRSLLTVSSVGAACFTALMLFGFVKGITQFLEHTHVYGLHIGHLVICKEDSIERHENIIRSEQATIERVLVDDPDVGFFAPQLIAVGLISNGCKGQPYRAYGISPYAARWIRTRMEELRSFHRNDRSRQGKGFWDLDNGDTAISISEGLAEEIGKKKVVTPSATNESESIDVLDCNAPDLEQRIAQDSSVQLVSNSFSGSLSALEASITQVYSTGLRDYDDDTILISLSTLQNMQDTDSVTSYAVYLYDSTRLAIAAKRLERQLRTSGLDISVRPWTDERISPNYVGPVQFLNVLAAFGAIVMTGLVSLSVYNTASITVLERRRELGTLRALGFGRASTIKLLIVESLLVAAVGSLIGILSSEAVAWMLNASGIGFGFPGLITRMRISVLISPSSIVVVMFVFMVATIVATWIAVQRVIHRKIISLLTDV